MNGETLFWALIAGAFVIGFALGFVGGLLAT